MLRLGIGTTVAFVLAALVATPVVAGEDERMQVMEDRLQALEDKLQESESLIGAQREMLAQHERALPAVGQGAGLDAFFSNLEVGGHVTASYIYNFNNPDNNLNAQDHFQFNRDHNSFEVDAVKLEIGKTAAEPGTAGFQIDLLLGENNNILASNLGYFDAGRNGDSGDVGIHLQEAYVTYNQDGILLTMGKFETHMGYEVLDSPYNPHVTHSTLYTFGIPLVHTGITASGAMNEDIVWMLGAVNGFNNSEDFNDNKGVIARIGMEQDNMSVLLNAFIGSEGLRPSGTKALICAFGAPAGTTGTALDCFGDNNNRTQIYELVATMELDDKTDLWLDAVYGYQELDTDVAFVLGNLIPAANDEDPQWYAIAVGGTMDLNDKTGLALRGEYFKDDGNFRIGHGVIGLGDAEHYSITGTLSHHLTDNLMARLEYRHDWVDGHGGVQDNVFFKHDNNLDDQQDIGILEVSYTFD